MIEKNWNYLTRTLSIKLNIVAKETKRKGSLRKYL